MMKIFERDASPEGQRARGSNSVLHSSYKRTADRLANVGADRIDQQIR